MSPTGPGAPAARVRMFVINDMRLDSRVRREAATLARSGYDVVVYAVLSDATAHLATEEVDGYTIIRVPMLMHPEPAGAASSSGARPAASLGRRVLASIFVATRPMFGGTLHFLANWQIRWRSWSRRVIDQLDPAEIWHAHDLNALPLALEAADRFGGLVVYDSHEIFTEAGATSGLPGVVRRILRGRERTWARRANAVITVNESLAAELRDRLNVDDVTVVHNCAAPPARGQSLPSLRARLGVGPDARVALYHGSVTIGRGLETLLTVFDDPRLGNTHLVVMGYGPLRPKLQELARASAASDRIHFLPPVRPSEVTGVVSGADVAIMPIEPTTLNHRLSSPNKLFEAIAAGVPIVGPDFVEFRRIVHNRWGALGVLHSDHEPSSIANAIHEVLSLPAGEYSAMRDRCRAAARARWNWDMEARRLLAEYRALAPLPHHASVLAGTMVRATDAD